MKTNLLAGALVISLNFVSANAGAAIVEISKPPNSNDDGSRPTTDGAWTVSAPPYPFDINSGIGYIINPSFETEEFDFTGHDHVYNSPFVPDPGRAVFTFAFDSPSIVNDVKLFQSQNGITRIEGFIGNSLDALVSVGSVFGPRGDVTGSAVFQEGETNIFTFTNSQPALYFRFVVRKSSLINGYGFYRAFPRDAAGVPFAGRDFIVTIRVSEVEVCWNPRVDRMYQVQYRSELTTNQWANLLAPIPGNSGTNCITDKVLVGQPRRFYRALEIP